MHRSEIIDRFTLDAQGSGLDPNRMKGEYPSMKKIIKNIVEYFALYGDLINSWNSL